MRFSASLRRLWKCCHPFTWVVMLVVGVALVIIVVPGMSPSKLRDGTTYLGQAEELLKALPPPATDSFSIQQVHGWPRPWAVTSNDVATITLAPLFSPPAPSPPRPYWFEVDSWPFFASHFRFEWRNLFVDLFVATTVIFAFGAAAELWLRRRGGLLRFRILDMLVVITGVGITLGWYQYHARLQSKEILLASNVTGVEWSSTFSPHNTRFNRYDLASDRVAPSEFEYTGPVWLLRLIGDERLLPALTHRTHAKLFVTADWKNDVSELELWSCLRDIEFFSVLPGRAVSTLDQLPLLESLTIRTHDGVTHKWMLGRYDLENNGGLVGPHDYSDLACLRLKHLTLENRELVAEDVDRIAAQLPTLKVLTLIEPSATPDEIDELRSRHPRLMLIAEWPTPPLDWDRTSPSTTDLQTDELKRRRAKMIEEQAAEANSAL